jgi:nucleoside-diphosphate-sugar epimerase
MRNLTVLITGSSGLIGRALCHRIGSAGANVIGLDKEGPPYPPSNTDCVFADLTSDESMQNAFHIVEERYGNKIDCVIHLAAYYSFSGHSSPLYKQLTVEGTERLFHELSRFAVGQFIFSSTMLVHAPCQPGQFINEESPIKPTWAYPESKVKTEKIISDLHGSIPTTILRIAGVYSDICESIPLAHQIQRIYEHQLTGHVYPGDTEAGQSFVHIDDLVDAFILCMNNVEKLDPYCVFLIGEQSAMTYDELQREIGLLLYGKAWETAYVPKPIAKAGAWLQDTVPLGPESFIKPWMVDRADDNYQLLTTRAQRVLGWQPQSSLRITLPKMIKGLKVDPIRWYQINHLPTPTWLKASIGDLHHKKSA